MIFIPARRFVSVSSVKVPPGSPSRVKLTGFSKLNLTLEERSTLSAGAAEVAADGLAHEGVELAERLRIAHEAHLEEAVVEADELGVELDEPGHGGGIGDAAEDEVALLGHAAVELDAAFGVGQAG